MNHPRLEIGLTTWRQDVEGFIGDARNTPDPQVTIAALVGAYIVGIESRSERTVHNWRQTVLADEPTAATLRVLLPQGEEYFDDADTVKISDYRNEKPWRHQVKVMNEAVLDGVPDGVEELSLREEYISRILGHAAYNFAIYLNPLGVDLEHARYPLRKSFPATLTLMQHGVMS